MFWREPWIEQNLQAWKQKKSYLIDKNGTDINNQIGEVLLLFHSFHFLETKQSSLLVLTRYFDVKILKFPLIFEDILIVTSWVCSTYILLSLS